MKELESLKEETKQVKEDEELSDLDKLMMGKG